MTEAAAPRPPATKSTIRSVDTDPERLGHILNGDKGPVTGQKEMQEICMKRQAMLSTFSQKSIKA